MVSESKDSVIFCLGGAFYDLGGAFSKVDRTFHKWRALFMILIWLLRSGSFFDDRCNF